jgi:Mn-dependent DtxR family transcriptional regulator
MADQIIRTGPQPVIPDALTAGERAILLNIEAHTNWSESGVVAALFEKGLITRHSGGPFVLTDQGRTTLDELLQSHRRVAESARILSTRRFRTEPRD